MGFTQLEVFVRSVGNRVDFDVVQKWRTSSLVSSTLVLGLFVGQYLGDYIKSVDTSEHVTHKGFFIWVLMVLFSLVGLIIERKENLWDLSS